MAILALSVVCRCAFAGYSTVLGFYPPADAPPRYADTNGIEVTWNYGNDSGVTFTTTVVFAKDVWRVEIGGALLERMAAVGATNDTVLDDWFPPRFGWEHDYISAMKSNVLAVAGQYLNLAYTNASGVFTNYHDTSLECFSNRFWTTESLLSYCSLPTNFFEFTPARFLGAGGPTNHFGDEMLAGYSDSDYGWEGMYRVVNALDYYEPGAAWRLVGVFETIQTGAWNEITLGTNVPSGACNNTNVWDGRYEIPIPYDAYVPSTIITNFDFTETSGGSASIVQYADGLWFDDDGIEAPVEYWAVRYSYNVPTIQSPSAKLDYYDAAYFPTGTVLDAQSFYRIASDIYDGSQYRVDADFAANEVTYGSVITNASGTQYPYTERGSWNIDSVVTNGMTNVVAFGANVSASAVFSLDYAVDVTRNPDTPCSTNSGTYGYNDFESISGPCPHTGSGPSLNPSPSWFKPLNFSNIDRTGCAEDSVEVNIWLRQYERADITHIVALRPNWKFKAN